MGNVIRQRKWSKEELNEAGFERFDRKKKIVMARQLPIEQAPMRIRTDQGDTIIAQAGYMICYDAGDELRATLSDYYHWPVEPQIFKETYRAWDEEFTPTHTMKHLMQFGCRPYYKAAGVWAKELQDDTYIQSIEHENPILVEKGRHLAIGSEGEPYHMSSKSFYSRYDVALDTEREARVKGILRKLVGFFKK